MSSSNGARIASWWFVLSTFGQTAVAVQGGASGNTQFSYTAGSLRSLSIGKGAYSFSSSTYEYTGMGAAESNLDFAPDGSLIYSPALTPAGNGIAISKDQGKTWRQILPGGPDQPRPQPVFRQIDGRFFFLSTKGPGFYIEYSDTQGEAWTKPLNHSHFDPLSQDWAKIVSGPPVSSSLGVGVQNILYYSAPSLISTPIPVQPLGPVRQLILKSTDKGSTWQTTKSMGTTLQPLLSGGACTGLLKSLAEQELIIWGDGFVTSNGTVMYGLRRCQSLSIAISIDEGDSWRLVDIPKSSLPPFILGDLTYLFNGNVLVPEPISIDQSGNIYAIWVDQNYVLKMSMSSDFTATWSKPVVIGAPSGLLNTTMAYLPTLRHHPNTKGRAVLAYYGSTDGGAHYNAYIAETGNINSGKPTFTSIIANDLSQPLQANKARSWDQGYGDPLYDLIEFMDVRYAPSNSGFGQDTIVAAFARSMCSGHSLPPALYDTSSCITGWNYTAEGRSRWQGIITIVKH